MRQLNAWTYAVFLAGCFLGPGFVSGNELTQFFGDFGLFGFLGLLIILFGIAALSTVVVAFAHDTAIAEADKLAFGDRLPILRGFVTGIQLGLMLAVLMIVTAGVGALLNSLLSLPIPLASLLFALLITLLSFFGLSGLLRFLSLVVPFLSLTVVVLAVLLLPRWVEAGFPMPHGETQNPLLPNSVVSALTYISFGLGGSIAILTPAATAIRRRHILPGSLIGSFLLVLVAAAILIVLSLYPAAMQEELPMPVAVKEILPALGILYSILLLLAMSGCALSKCYGIRAYFATKWRFPAHHPRLFTVALVSVAYLCSLVGFGDLIGVLYPIFGYLSFLLLVAILVRAVIYVRRKKKKTE